MNTSDTDNTDNTDQPIDRAGVPDTDTSRPFGHWLKAVDRLMAAEFARAFDGEHADRRDWRLLNVVDGTAPARRPLHARKLRALIERGWVKPEGDGWALTDDGRAAKERLGEIVDGIRAKVTDAVSPEDLATTIASLEQIARAFGWDENASLPRGRGRGHGFGPHAFGPHGFGRRGFGRAGFAPRFDRDFDPEHGTDPEHGFDPEHGISSAHHADHDCGHRGHDRSGHDRSGHDRSGHDRSGHHRHGDHRGARHAQHAYERGFDAGFTRGRDA